MVHGLRAAHAVVDDDAEAVVAQALLLGHPLRDEEQVPQGRLVPVAGGLGEPAEPVAALGDDEEVDGGLRRDVAEGWSFFLESVRVFSYRGREKKRKGGGAPVFLTQALVVLEDDVSRDLLRDDLVEERGVSGVGALRGAVWCCDEFFLFFLEVEVEVGVESCLATGLEIRRLHHRTIPKKLTLPRPRASRQAPLRSPWPELGEKKLYERGTDAGSAHARGREERRKKKRAKADERRAALKMTF